jgi:hypothetical protein
MFHALETGAFSIDLIVCHKLSVENERLIYEAIKTLEAKKT